MMMNNSSLLLPIAMTMLMLTLMTMRTDFDDFTNDDATDLTNNTDDDTDLANNIDDDTDLANKHLNKSSE